MNKVLLLFTCLLINQFTFAQAESVKIKGNKILEVKTIEISEFKTLEIGGEFEVSLVLKSEPSVRIETDSNLHQYITVSVDAERLTVKTIRNFTRTKKLNLEIGYTAAIAKIMANGKVKVVSSGSIDVERLAIEASENASVTLNTRAKRVDILSKGKSNVKTTIVADAIGIHANDSGEIEATLTTESLNIAQNQKSEISLNGKATKNSLFLLDNTYFFGANLETATTVLSIESSSKAYVNVTDKLQLKASGKSEVSVLSNPVIELQTFTDDTTLKKLSKVPSSFKRFF